jgi:hypothetical protein
MLGLGRFTSAVDPATAPGKPERAVFAATITEHVINSRDAAREDRRGTAG